MKPKVLLVMTCCWVPPTRLSMALSQAGCEVEAVCPPGHLIAYVHTAGRRYFYNGFSRSILSAIRKSKPDFVIPCDDYATQSLHSIYWEERSANSDIAVLLERSFGQPDNYAVTTARSRLLAVAARLGIRVPETEIVADKRALANWFEARGFPAYLKADGTSGGVGVRLIENCDQADAAFDQLSAPPGILRALKRTVIDQDFRLIAPCLNHVRPVMSIQPVVRGPEANCAAACWRGKMVACISVKVEERTEELGPASVVRVIDNLQMHEAMEKLADKLGLTGLFGLDFILDEKTGDAYLLEMNARATQTSHLMLGPGRSPAAALVQAMMGTPDTPLPPSATDRELIALFPQEWKRDPNSEFLRTAYQDIPADEPDLMRECMKTTLRDRKWRS